MSRKLYGLAALLLCFCGRAEKIEEELPPPPAPRASSSSSAAPVEAREIYIDSVAAGNPLVVRGRARTFENTVSLRVLDSAGTLVVEGYTTSMGEMGRHNPFEAELWLARDPGEQITVEAFEYSAKDGSVRSLVRSPVRYSVDTIRAELFFPVGDCDRIQSFTRTMPKSRSMARLLVEALIAGPAPAERALGADPPFPKGSAVRSVNLRDGVLTVDFNERLQNVGGACAARAIRDSVSRTLGRLPTVREVVITAGGRADLALQP